MNAFKNPGDTNGRPVGDGGGLLEVQRLEDASGVTVKVSGELDIASAPKLMQTLSEADIGAGAAHTVLDLSELVFIDSTGLACLIAADRDARASGRVIHLRGVRGQVEMLISLSGLTERFTFED